MEGEKRRRIAAENRITEWMSIRCSPKQKAEIWNAIRNLSEEDPRAKFSTWALSILLPAAKRINAKAEQDAKSDRPLDERR